MSRPHGTMVIGRVMTLDAVTLIIRRAPNNSTAAKRLGKSRASLRNIKLKLRDAGKDPSVGEDCATSGDHHCVLCGAIDNVVIPMGKQANQCAKE